MIYTTKADPSDSSSEHWSNAPTFCHCRNCGELVDESEMKVNRDFACEIHYCTHCENEIHEEIKNLQDE